jgi:hypothetical protein
MWRTALMRALDEISADAAFRKRKKQDGEPEINTLRISDEDATVLGQFLGIGRGCRKALEWMEGDNHPTIGALMHTHHKLLSFLLRGATSTALDKRITQFCQLAANNCSIKFNTEVDCAAQISAVLDPRYRQLTFLPGTDAGKCTDALLGAYTTLKRVYGDDSPVQPPTTKKRKKAREDADEVFSYDIDEDSPSRAVITTEVQRYLALPNEPKSTNVLEWWMTHAAGYPLLAQLARRYLAIPASSASSERLFSRLKLIATDARQNLKADTLCMLLFIEAHHHDSVI